MKFFRHFSEMVLAMTAGMLLFGQVWELLDSPVLARPDVSALVMATNMTLGMSIWMRYRGHGWAYIAEMGVAMYLPLALVLVPYWAGVMLGEVIVHVGHVVMLPAMALVMLRPGRLVEALKHRWPTWLALLMTFDNWFEPVIPSPWILLILPLGYLLIGSLRKQWGDRRMLVLQLGGLMAYLALTLVAVSVAPEVARYLVAAGWLAHAGWDFVHHRLNKVVPRAYAEWCAVIDAVIGLTIIFLM